jgi:hypothetical protein
MREARCEIAAACFTDRDTQNGLAQEGDDRSSRKIALGGNSGGP